MPTSLKPLPERIADLYAAAYGITGNLADDDRRVLCWFFATIANGIYRFVARGDGAQSVGASLPQDNTIPAELPRVIAVTPRQFRTIIEPWMVGVPIERSEPPGDGYPIYVATLLPEIQEALRRFEYLKRIMGEQGAAVSPEQLFGVLRGYLGG